MPEPDDEGPLYVARRKIYPQRVKGIYRTIKWIVLFVTLGVYYGLPFVRWDRGPGAPDQAVLIDFPNRRFYFFFVELWPQEIYYLTGLLILAAMTLFLITRSPGGYGAAICVRRRYGPTCFKRSSAGSRAIVASTCSATGSGGQSNNSGAVASSTSCG